MANRVCTTDRSSAKSSATVWPARSATGESATAVIAVVSVASSRMRSIARMASVVVPLRLITIVRSIGRFTGSSVGVKASVTPSPMCSSARRAA